MTKLIKQVSVNIHICGFSMMPNLLLAAESSGHGIDGSGLGLLWTIPFVGILLSIAICPLVNEEWWHHNFGKVSAFWGLLLIIPMTVFFGYESTLYEVLHAYLLEYFPFIILLLALFTISGGVRIKGYLKGTPEVNTAILLIGTLLASWMGTTGATNASDTPHPKSQCMAVNEKACSYFLHILSRKCRRFFNSTWGSTTFSWIFARCRFFLDNHSPFLGNGFVATILLVVYYMWDKYLYNKETNTPPKDDGNESLGIEGSFNLLLILGVVAAVLFSGLVHLGEITIYHVHVKYENLFRDALLLCLTWISWKATSKESRSANGFNWFPIQEVGKLFAGIFITIIAPIAMLKAANQGQGALQFINNAVFDGSGDPINSMFFWITGTLSAFLDNAPTYLVLFNAAGGNAEMLMNEMTSTLIAISAGAVFFGALTYIGNAPNFMVKSIADQNGVKMPSFGGYMIWSVGILVPIYILVTLIFI